MGIEEFREAEDPVYIRFFLYVERESQKGIVVGAGGVPTAKGAHKVIIRLSSTATYVPKGSRFTVTLPAPPRVTSM